MRNAGLAVSLALLLSLGCKPDAPAKEVATIQVTSTPAGAKVALDGRPLEGVTPLQVPDVTVFEAHEVEVTLPGKPTWRKRFAASNLKPTVLHAEWVADLPPPPQAPPAPAPAAVEPDAGAPEATPGDAGPPAGAAPDAGPPAADAPGTAPDGGHLDGGVAPTAAASARDAGPDAGVIYVEWPVEKVRVQARRSAVIIPGTPAASVDLNPKKSYRVWTEGVAALGPKASSPSVAYLLEGADPNDTFGTFQVKPTVIKGARKAWLFAVDDDPSDNKGSLRVYFQESKLVAPRVVVWDAAQHVAALEPEEVFTVDRLDPAATYLLALKDVGLNTRASRLGGGRLRKLMCQLRSPQGALSVAAGLRVFEAFSRKPYEVTGADQLRCFFPDDALEDNAGEMLVELEQH